MTVTRPKRGKPLTDEAKAAVLQMEAEVVQRRTAGQSFTKIERELGISNADRIYTRAMKTRPRQARDEALALEAARLDELTEVWHKEALTGVDPKAATVALGITDRRAKLEGLNHSDRIADAHLALEAGMLQLLAGALTHALSVVDGLTTDQKRQILTVFSERVDQAQDDQEALL